MPAITLSSNDLACILTFCMSLARRAGDVILAGSEAILASGHIDEKKNSVDLVTEYDVKVEQLVKGELNKQYHGYKLRVCGLLLVNMLELHIPQNHLKKNFEFFLE